MSTEEQEELGAAASEKKSTDDHNTAITEHATIQQQYTRDVVRPLRELVSRPREEINEECIDDIRGLLARRLPDGVCEEGQEDHITPLRAKLWSIMLLGLRPEDLDRFVGALCRGLFVFSVLS